MNKLVAVNNEVRINFLCQRGFTENSPGGPALLLAFRDFSITMLSKVEGRNKGQEWFWERY